MDVLAHLALGFSTALTPANLGYCFIGVCLGMVVGVLPGIGPVTTIALLLPFTFSLSATSALIMLAGIYYGSQYGGSTTAILINLPGEASATVTCLDGHAMARQGRAGQALAVASVSSFIGGTLGTLAVAALSGPLAALASSFEAADYVALMAFGLALGVVLAQGAMMKATAMVLLGLLLGAVGSPTLGGPPRFTFGLTSLADGIGFVPLAVGLFGLAEIIDALESARAPSVMKTSGHVRLEPGEAKRALLASLRGTMLGAALGVLPGGGPVIASFAAYAVERKLLSVDASPRYGAVEGVAAPESANNAAAQTSFIPLLTLGIPSNPVVALLLGGLVVHGVQPGPEVITKQPELFWGLIASMWIGNAMLLAINLPLVGLWAQLLRVPQRFLLPATVALCCIGVYGLNHNPFELVIAAAFGIMGYGLRNLGCEPAPLLLGFILSQPIEENLQRALSFSHGDPTTFLVHPRSAALLAISIALLVSAAKRRA
ncbi:MAG: tripartite tricarboxylate transporter permease [Deltaproteobacteria bacterium]